MTKTSQFKVQFTFSYKANLRPIEAQVAILELSEVHPVKDAWEKLYAEYGNDLDGILSIEKIITNVEPKNLES